VYIVDDDVAFPVSIVSQYLERMASMPGVWGHAGHARSAEAENAKWIVRPRKPALVDYANAAWFLQTSWIAGAFLREPPSSRLTGEDIHLSYIVRRVLGLETRVVGWRRDRHPYSKYTLGMTDVTTLTPSMFSLRSFIVRALAARGPVMRQPPALDALAFVETADQAEAIASTLEGCAEQKCRAALCDIQSQHLLRAGTFRMTLVFSGLQQLEERLRIEAAAFAVCTRLSTPSCAYIPHELCGAICEDMQFAEVSSFNLQVGHRLGAPSPTTASSLAALAADALEASAGLFSSLKLAHLLVPNEDSHMRRMVLQAADYHSEANRPRHRFSVTEVALDVCIPSEGRMPEPERV